MLKPYYHNYQEYCEIKSVLVWPKSATCMAYAQDLRQWGDQSNTYDGGNLPEVKVTGQGPPYIRPRSLPIITNNN